MNRIGFRQTAKGLLVAAALVARPAAAAGPRQAEYEVGATAVASVADLDTGLASTGADLSLRLRAPDLGRGLSAEALLALGLSADRSGNEVVTHRSPFLRLGWRPGSWTDREGLSLTVFPLSSERLHLGWESPASWGRTMGFYASSAPATELRLAREGWYGFLAARSALDLNELTHEQERQWMALGGAGLALLSAFRVEVEGAAVERGTPSVALGVPTGTKAIAARVLYHCGDSIRPSVDFSFSKDEPEFFDSWLLPESYPGGFSASASLEATHLAQTLVDPANHDAGKAESADVVALQLRAKAGFLRAHLLGLYRSATFPTNREYPGVSGDGAALVDGVTTRGELLLRGGVDHHFASLHLTPGLIFGGRLPAVIDALVGPMNGAASARTFVVGQGAYPLPAGEDREVALTAKATLRWDWKDALSAVGELYWERDPNFVRHDASSDGTSGVLRERMASFGFSALLQLRF